MDANVVTRARSKAEEVRAALQREQRLAVERRLQQQQQGTAAAAPPSAAVTAKAEPDLAREQSQQETEVNQRISSSTGLDSSSDVTTRLQQQTVSGDSKPSSTSTGTASAEQAATSSNTALVSEQVGSPSLPPSLPGPRVEESQPAPIAPMPDSDTSTAVTSLDRQKRDVGSPGVMATSSASITQQVLSSSTSSSGPRYLRYRDSLKRVSVSGSMDREEVRSALKAKEQFEQVEGNDELKNQLVSYLDKSVSGTAVATTTLLSSSYAMKEPDDDRLDASDVNAKESHSRRYVKGDPSKSTQEMAVVAALASAAAAKRLSEEEKDEQDSMAPEAETLQRQTEGRSSSQSNDEDKAYSLSRSSSKSPKESSVTKSTTANRVVSFDVEPDDTENTRNRMEDMSESESSYHGTLTLKEYRRRRALQCGVVVLFFVISPLAIGLGVAYSNRGAPEPVGNSTNPETVSTPVPTVAPSSTFLRPVAPTTVPSPSAAPATGTGQIIGFPPLNSILDLLNSDGTAQQQDGDLV